MIKGIGCDIVEHERINLTIAKKVLFETEVEQFNASNNQIEFLASRFAIKEAIIKATNKQFLMKDIIITNGHNGEPLCNIQDVLITVSHEKKYSMAIAIWEKND